MGIDALLTLLIAGLNHTTELAALFAKVQSEGRTTLTPEELAAVRATAVTANEALGRAAAQ